MTFPVEIEPGDDGRRSAAVLELPGALAYGRTPAEAQAKVQALALRGHRGPSRPCRSRSRPLAHGVRRRRSAARTRARRVLAALLRMGWRIQRQDGSHRVVSRPGWSDLVVAFHEADESGPRMLARIARRAGRELADLAR